MSFDDVQIRSKIILIIAILATVVVTGCTYAAVQMQAIDDEYSDIIGRVNVSATLAARGTRALTRYGYLSYKLAAETTDEGDAQLLAALKVSGAEYNDLYSKIRENLPEYKAELSRIGTIVAAAMSACASPIDYASKATMNDEVIKASLRIKTECDPPLNAAIEVQH